jgi:mono/diheme cytochrome c family protein
LKLLRFPPLCLAALLGPHLAAQAATGAELFAANCQACHQASGEGAPGIAPPLTGTLAKRAALPEGRAWLAQTLVSGMTGPITSRGEPYNGIMPPFAALPDADLAALLGHVLSKFNDSTASPSPDDFAAARTRSVKPSEHRAQRSRLLAQTGE